MELHIKLAAAAILLQAALQANARIFYSQIHTTFRPLQASDEQPWDYLNATGFHPHHADAKCDDSSVYPGFRLIQDSKKNEWPDYDKGGDPTMIIIYDSSKRAAGLQSLVPSDSFVGWDCGDNEFYNKEVIEGVEYCVLTAYFYDPAQICRNDLDSEHQLHFQKGNSYKPENLVKVPQTFLQADFSDFWNKDKFFPGMGHHFTRKEGNREDCTSFMPFQALYAYIDGHCESTGLIFQHYNTDVVDTRYYKKKDAWEAPPSLAIRAILSNPAQCQLESADKKYIKTMHAFLAPSRSYCLFK